MIPLLASLALQQPGSWAFAYPESGKGAPLLDLRALNEKRAGETGYVRVSPDRRGFVRGDGKPIRFWPVNGTGERLPPGDMAAIRW